MVGAAIIGGVASGLSTGASLWMYFDQQKKAAAAAAEQGKLERQQAEVGKDTAARLDASNQRQALKQRTGTIKTDTTKALVSATSAGNHYDRWKAGREAPPAQALGQGLSRYV